MSTGWYLILFLYWQEPVSHIVARPSPSDILEWRKFVSHLHFIYCFMLSSNFQKEEKEFVESLVHVFINVVEPVTTWIQHINLTLAPKCSFLNTAILSTRKENIVLCCQKLNSNLFGREWLKLDADLIKCLCLRLRIGRKWGNTFLRFNKLWLLQFDILFQP